MLATAQGWTPDPFHTDFERRADGSLLPKPRGALAPPFARMMDALVHWALEAPDRICVARRGIDGGWIEQTYRQTLERVQRIAASLVTRNLSADRPIVILSGNSIEHLLLGWAAMWAGVPYCPVSPSYSQLSSDLQKRKLVFELLTPGLIAAFDTTEFSRALQLAPAGSELVGDVESLAGRTLTPFERLDAAPALQLERAHAATSGDSIARFLLTSGSTGQPKAVIETERMICTNASMVGQALPFLCDEPPVPVDWLPWNHTFGGSHNIGLFLFNGGTLYIDDGKPTPSGVAATIRNLREISPHEMNFSLDARCRPASTRAARRPAPCSPAYQ